MFFLKKTPSKFALLLVYIAVFINSGYALITLDSKVEFFFLVPATILMLYYASVYYGVFKQKWRTYQFVYFGLITACLLTFIVNGDFDEYTRYGRFLFVFTLAYCFTQVYSFSSFSINYIKTMKFIVIASLGVYFAVNFLHINLPFPVVTNINDISYYNGLITFVMKHAPERNTGFFWEPGIFASFLIIALIIEVLFKEKPNLFNIALFTVAVVTTQSTGGILLLAPIGLLLINRKNKTNLLLQYSLLSIIIFISLFANTLLSELNLLFPSIFGKLVTESSSISTRLEGPIIDLSMFLNNPLFGVGFKEYYSIWEDMTYNTLVNAQTSTITYFIATMGSMGILFMYGLINGILKLRDISLLSRITVFLIFVFILSKEPHQHNTLMYILIFYFLKIRTVNYNLNPLRKELLYGYK